MTDKEVRRLSRKQLLELLIAQNDEIDRLNAKLGDAENRIKELKLLFNDAVYGADGDKKHSLEGEEIISEGSEENGSHDERKAYLTELPDSGAAQDRADESK